MCLLFVVLKLRYYHFIVIFICVFITTKFIIVLASTRGHFEGLHALATFSFVEEDRSTLISICLQHSSGTFSIRTSSYAPYSVTFLSSL